MQQVGVQGRERKETERIQVRKGEEEFRSREDLLYINETDK